MSLFADAERRPAVLPRQPDVAAATGFAAAVAAGDEAQVAAVVRHHHPRLCGYLRRLGADPGLAEDIAQESLWRAVLACRRGRAPAALGPWLYAVATNLWRDAVRSAERRHTTLGLPPETASPGDAADEAVEAEAVRSALHHLPLTLRTVVVLHFYEGLKLREVAAATGAPLGTVKWRLHAALRRMRRVLDAAGGREFR